MKFNKILIATLTVCSSVAFAAPTNDAMRAAADAQVNAKYSSCLSLTKDEYDNVIGVHVNGLKPEDVNIFLTKSTNPLSTEFVTVTGLTKEGGASSYMLPANIATAQVIESISRDLVNSGVVSIQITKQKNTATN